MTEPTEKQETLTLRAAVKSGGHPPDLRREEQEMSITVGAELASVRRISDALSQAAIAAANEKYVTGGRGGFGARHDNRRFSFIIRSIVAGLFVAQVFCLTVYLAFFASDQYQVESRFAIRSVSTPLGDVLSSLGGASNGATKSETAIVTKYVSSEALVRLLDTEIGLRHLYARDEADHFSSFNVDRPLEDLLSYWKWKVGVSEETSTGIITMKVAAFRPEDALLISRAIIEKADALVNGLSEKSRQSLLSLAQKRLDRARQRLEDVAGEMARLRNRTGILDTGTESEAQLKLISALELELAKLLAARSSVANLSSESVRVRSFDSQIARLRAEIDKQKAKLTGALPGQKGMSEAMVQFDKLQVDHKVAQEEFTSAAAAFEDARIGAERQQFYLSVFMNPALPESSTYPKRWLIWFVGLAGFATLTLVCVMIARAIRDNRAV